MTQSDQEISGLYQSWFLDYASYVILDRAIPSIEDGLKPVQRRLLHALKELDDGRFNKAANVIGHTMRYHPHGDAAIGDALVKLAQKDLLIDTQGNWGNILTGDRAAAPRYIEARLGKMAHDILFHEATTQWQDSYDGRNREPVNLPVKFPLLLAMGADGIAVGLATRILPHNVCELIEASIAWLSGKKVELYPDFQSGGYLDVSDYQDGMRGGKVRSRAVIEAVDLRTLMVKAIPFGTTTTSVIESIIAANDKGKIKVKRVEDNTASEVDIRIYLPQGVTAEQTIPALYAFTDCEVSISTNCCVIRDQKPWFCSVSDLLEANTKRTMELLDAELRHRRGVVAEKLQFSLLEQLFVAHKIYRKLEQAESWDALVATLFKAMQKFDAELLRPVTEDDIVRLTEIKIKRISKFDHDQAALHVNDLKEQLAKIDDNLAHIKRYTIGFFKYLLKNYGKAHPRKTQLITMTKVEAAAVAVANQKVYIDRQEGFVGTALKEQDLLGPCSELDEVLVIRDDGCAFLAKVSGKTFVGKGILAAFVQRPSTQSPIFNLVYRKGEDGPTYAKRVRLEKITRNKAIFITAARARCHVLYFSTVNEHENDVVTITFPESRGKKKGLFVQTIDIALGELPLGGRDGDELLISRSTATNVVRKRLETQPSSSRELWFDHGHINERGQGRALGKVTSNHRLIALMRDGRYESLAPSLNLKFGDDLIELLVVKGDTVTLAYLYQDAQGTFAVRRNLDLSAASGRFHPDENAKIHLVTMAGPDHRRLQEGKPVALSSLLDINQWFKKS